MTMDQLAEAQRLAQEWLATIGVGSAFRCPDEDGFACRRAGHPRNRAQIDALLG